MNYLNKKYGAFSVTQYKPLVFDELGSPNGGYIKLVNQETMDTIHIYNTLDLRARKWYTQSFKGVRLEDKTIAGLIEKISIAFNKYEIK